MSCCPIKLWSATCLIVILVCRLCLRIPGYSNIVNWKLLPENANANNDPSHYQSYISEDKIPAIHEPLYNTDHYNTVLYLLQFIQMPKLIDNTEKWQITRHLFIQSIYFSLVFVQPTLILLWIPTIWLIKRLQCTYSLVIHTFL